jgi:hypothetical protein
VYVASVLAVTVLTVALRFTPFPIQGIVFLLILGIVVTELRQHPAAPLDRRCFWAALATLTVAACFSAADVTGVFCDPENHFVQGHAIWHVLGAISLVFSAFFYRRIPDLWEDA